MIALISQKQGNWPKYLLLPKMAMHKNGHMKKRFLCWAMALILVAIIIITIHHFALIENDDGSRLKEKIEHANDTHEAIDHLKFMPFSSPPFVGWDLLGQINCSRVLLANDRVYISGLARNRIRFSDPEELDMDCRMGIRRRNYFPEKGQMQEDADFPLAQGRMVYKNYVLVEKELASAYSPHNWYCYVVDIKADKLFKWRMRQLAKCLPNVILSDRELYMDSAGHNYTRAYLDCMELLTVPDKKWEYVALLQNHDIAIKTNREAVQIYRWMDGANDVHMNAEVADDGRIDYTADWNFKALQIFKNKTKNSMSSINGFPAKLVFAKGLSEYSLSRKMAQFLLHDLDLRVIMDRFDKIRYAADEVILSTLNDADAIQAPGGFTRKCWTKGQALNRNGPIFLSRITIWDKPEQRSQCHSGIWRHGICIFGLQDLAPNLAKWPHLFVNKMMPDFDFGALLCWWQEMHRRAYGESREQSLARLDKHFYTNMPSVRFHKLVDNLAKSNLTEEQYTIRYKEAVEEFECIMPRNAEKSKKN